MFELRFPSLAARVENCAASLEEQGYSSETSRPMYGYWYNFCVNGPREHVQGVMTKPHVDGKNLALMMCVVFVWGE